MAKAFSLQPLLEIMQNRADEATRKLGQLIAAEQSQKSRLQMLEQYRGEYFQRLREATTQGISPLTLRNYQDFLARIDEAIEQQRVVVLNSENSTRAGQENWKAQNKQLKAIDTLSQRHEARERYRENKQEQKILDEFATRKHVTRDIQE
jgi:flagellar FliJ protein